jgi:class 3 adenylate cyclase/CheY-like chemotaxis protein
MKYFPNNNILIIDDKQENIFALEQLLRDKSYHTISAQSGEEALKILLKEDIALILLDVQMPGMNGFETAQLIKGNNRTKDIPIIFLTAISRERKFVIEGLLAGAVDYLTKPIDAELLLIKVEIFLLIFNQQRELKYQKEELESLNVELTTKNCEIEQAHSIIAKEQEKSEALLLNILPKSIADRLKAGESIISDYIHEASVLFLDIAGFTTFSNNSTPQKIVRMLNEIFTLFDKIALKYNVEKIKTIGDSYMAACGIPIPDPDHVNSLAKMALEIKETIKHYRTNDGEKISIRIGLNCGPVIAGVIGKHKFIYDLWGDTVNTASRMESSGVEGKIHVTEWFREKCTINEFEIEQLDTTGQKGKIIKPVFVERGVIEVKGKGKMRTFFLESE